VVVVASLAGTAIALLTLRVDGVSMAPTLQDGDHLLLDRTIGLRSPLRGDIVLMVESNGVPAVKRVVGLPRDTLEIDGSAVRPDAPGAGHPALLVKPGGLGPWQRLDEPYARGAWRRADFCCDVQGHDGGRTANPVTLPPDEFYVMGDNRDASIDSRSFGPVPRDRILARVWLRYWPLTRAGTTLSGPTLVPTTAPA
jgi:signal peptidase I